jgi:hypothetical protein
MHSNSNSSGGDDFLNGTVPVAGFSSREPPVFNSADRMNATKAVRIDAQNTVRTIRMSNVGEFYG